MRAKFSSNPSARRRYCASETADGDAKLARVLGFKVLPDELLQFVGRQLAGVDQHVRPAPQGFQQVAFGADAVHCGAPAGKRVAPAGFVIAPLQLGIVAVDELGGQFEVVSLAQGLRDGDDDSRREAARARIEPDGERCAVFPGEHFAHQRTKQADGKIVDRFPAKVLEHAQAGGLARAGHARDQHDLLSLAHRFAFLCRRFAARRRHCVHVL